MIDLHLHTIASDGRSSPEGLVREVVAKRITTFAVTDHDTSAAHGAVADAAKTAGISFVPGIEITAVSDGRDLHILGYFFDPKNRALVAFLERQRTDRRRRLEEMAGLLSRLGVPVDVDQAIAEASATVGKSLGRPTLAAALVSAGHVATPHEAFDRYLSAGRPAFIERNGSSPALVVDLLRRARGLSSMAHPAKTRRDNLIPDLVDAGLSAIEVYNPDHDAADVQRYRMLATQYGVLVTGGSDYHGVDSGRTNGFGRVQLPAEDFQRLADRAGWSGA